MWISGGEPMTGGWDLSTWVWPVMLVVGLSVLIAGLVLLHRARPAPTDADAESRPGTARAVLDERLARGEIDVTEYERRRAVLDEH